MDKDLKKITENTRAQMRKGFLEYCVLLVIAKEPTYVGEIISELKHNDLIVVEGTIYPLLSRLKKAGLLTYSWKESKNGPPRKYYEVTSRGTEVIESLTDTWQQLDTTVNKLLT